MVGGTHPTKIREIVMKQGISSAAGNTSKVFVSEFTTVWSFAERGAWATHTPEYRGNFAPQVARNIIEMYSEHGETVLDAMVGGGTTLIECKLLGRRGIGVDINPAAVEMTKQKLMFKHTPLQEVKSKKEKGKSEDVVRVGDVRRLSFLPDGSVDLILTHPPYLNIIRYSEGIEGDLSGISSLKKFCGEMEAAARELYRVLKAGRYCAILMGDTRRGRHFVPLAWRVMERFLKAGFVLKEDIIKVQHNCAGTGRWKWKAQKDKFYLIMHEHLFVFRKPAAGEDLGRVRESVSDCIL
jgi:DNA modification methylase